MARGQQIIQKLVVREFATEIMPRKDDEINPEELEAWQQETAMEVPYSGAPVTPNEIKKFIEKISRDLDLKDLIFVASMFASEQGRTTIGIIH